MPSLRISIYSGTSLPATLGTCKSGWISWLDLKTSLIQPCYNMAELAGLRVLCRRAREIINGAALAQGVHVIRRRGISGCALLTAVRRTRHVQK